MPFVKGAERTLTQPDFVRATLRSLTDAPLDQPRVVSVAANLKVEEIGDHTFRVTYKNKSGVPPVEFLTAHLRGYVQGEITKSVREVSAKVAFLSDQLKTVEGDLNRLGADRATFRELNVDRLPEDAALTSSSRHTLETRRADQLAEIHRLEGDLKGEEAQLHRDSPLARAKFQASETYRQSLVDVNRKLSEALARGLTDGHPEVQQLKDEKQRIQNLVKDELSSQASTLTRETDPNYQAARGRVDKLRADLGAARTNLAESDKALGRLRKVEQDLPRVEQQLSDLDHRQTATKQLHGELFSKLKQAEIQLNLEKVSAESRYRAHPRRAREAEARDHRRPARRDRALPRSFDRAVSHRLPPGAPHGVAGACHDARRQRRDRATARRSPPRSALINDITDVVIATSPPAGARTAGFRRRLARVALTAVIAVGGLSFAGCATEGAFVWVQDMPLADPQPGPPVIGRATRSSSTSVTRRRSRESSWSGTAALIASRTWAPSTWRGSPPRR